MSPSTNLSSGSLASNSGAHNITADQGATFSYTVTYKNAKRKAHDVTGFTASMQIRPATNSSVVSLELTTENGRINVIGAEGRFDLYIAASDMSSLDQGIYVYDLQVQAPVTGFVDRLIMGNFTVRSEVTR
jgi:hypothetical protein